MLKGKARHSPRLSFFIIGISMKLIAWLKLIVIAF